MNSRSILFVFSLAFVLASASSFAQNLPHMSFKVLKNDTVSFTLKANGYSPIDILPPTNGDIPLGSPLGRVDGHPSLKYYKMMYLPNPDFVGHDRAVIEYLGTPGTSVLSYHQKIITIDFEVVNSLVEANTDVFNLESGSLGDTLDVLDNDVASEGEISLKRVFNAKNGVASMVGDRVLFIPNQGFEGTAFFNYEIEDGLGSSTVGEVIVNVVSHLPQRLSYYVTNTSRVSISKLPLGFELSEDSDLHLGELSFVNSPEIVYTPFVDSLGVEEFTLTDGVDSVVIEVNVVQSKKKGNVLVDDLFFAAENTGIRFNVKNNDYKKNYFNISYTPTSNGTLVHNGQGKFTYTPNKGFRGIDEFTYTAQLSFSLYQSATVKIVVDNFYPINSKPYSINTSKNNQVVLNYSVPIEGYYFELNAQADDGEVVLYNGFDTVFVNCTDVAGKNLIVYTPPSDYVGTDRFELRYCPPNGACRVVKFNVNVLEEVADSVCSCVSNDCVWPGDIDNDGKVDVADLLPIGKFFGRVGSARSDSTRSWLGLSSEDWTYSDSEYDVNLKHVDADGNGVIGELDSLEVLKNYGKTHNMYNNVIINKADYPIYLKSVQDTIVKGKELNLYVEVGDEKYPARDLSGISYTMYLDPDIVDSSTLHHQFLVDSWLGNSSTSLQFSNQILDGRVDAAFVRVSPFSVTGIGKVSKCDLLVEDDLDGLVPRSSLHGGQEIIPVKFRLSDIKGITDAGKMIGFPDQELVMFLKIEAKDYKDGNPNVRVYPNPAYDFLQLSSVNTQIKGYRMYNTMGQLKSQSFNKKNGSFDQRVDISDLNRGVYFIDVITSDNKRITKKVEIIR